MKFDDVNIGGQLKVGTGVCRAIKEGRQKINGSALIEGPVVLGGPGEFAAQEATLMVGPTTNDDPDSTMPESSLGVSGSQPTAIKTKGNQYIEGDLYSPVVVYSLDRCDHMASCSRSKWCNKLHTSIVRNDRREDRVVVI